MSSPIAPRRRRRSDNCPSDPPCGALRSRCRSDRATRRLFQGPAIGSDGDLVAVQGVRLRRQIGRSLAEFAVTQNSAGSETNAARTELLGLATSLGTLTFVGEAALQQQRGDDVPGSAFAYQGRVDVGGFQSGWSATLRHIPERFLLYGTGEAYGDSYADVSFRRFFHGQLASAEVGYDTTSLGGITSSQRRTLFSLRRSSRQRAISSRPARTKAVRRRKRRAMVGARRSAARHVGPARHRAAGRSSGTHHAARRRRHRNDGTQRADRSQRGTGFRSARRIKRSGKRMRLAVLRFPARKRSA